MFLTDESRSIYNDFKSCPTEGGFVPVDPCGLHGLHVSATHAPRSKATEYILNSILKGVSRRGEVMDANK